MLSAIITTIFVLIVLAVLAIVIFRVRLGRNGAKARERMRVRAVTSVGIAAETPKTSIGASAIPMGSTAGNSKELRSRFVALGVLVGAAFTALTAKLFSMQVLNASEYSQEAEQNLYTTVSTPAPRGVVYDSEGVALITNRQVQTVVADADVADNHDVLLRLSGLLGIPYEIVRSRIQDSSSGAQSQRVVASDVRLRDVAYLAEHADAFPGVSVQQRTTRTYPYGALAAHALGYVGTASEDDLKNTTEGRSIESGDKVGKSGIEQAYDDLLAGDHGQRTLITNASGVVQQVVSETDPAKGNDIYLTINAKVQYVADTTLKGAIDAGKGTAAACVLMDVKTGGIVAMSSYPYYEPEHFIDGIAQDTWDKYQTEESGYPLLNRAIAGTYPAASCFKAFTGLAALTYGYADSTRTWTCTGTWTGFGEAYAQKCWQHSGHGTENFRQGVVNSCDVVFYEIAKSFYEARDSIGTDALQDFVSEFGYGSKTNVDIAGESKGRVPTPEWKQEYFKDYPEQAQWLPGDMSNMVIGQGNILVTPIQVARSYACVATGKLLRPHLLKEVHNSLGETVLSYETQEDAAPDVSEANLNIMRDALLGVATDNANVAKAYSCYGWQGAGKTGTGEVAGQRDMAWFSCYAPYDDPKYALSVCVEQGISGSGTGAPLAGVIMNAAIQASEGTLEVDLQALTADESYTVAEVSSSSSGRQD